MDEEDIELMNEREYIEEKSENALKKIEKRAAHKA